MNLANQKSNVSCPSVALIPDDVTIEYSKFSTINQELENKYKQHI